MSEETLKMLLEISRRTELEIDRLIELGKNEPVVEELYNSITHGEDYELHDSVSALGWDHTDNECRDFEESNEMFGMFLLEAYKTGNSKSLFFEFKDGKILEAPLVM